MLCFGCGEDLMDARVRRSLETEHVVPLWSQLFNDELQTREERVWLRQTNSWYCL